MSNDNVIPFRSTNSVINDLESLLILARKGMLVGLCGYAVFTEGDVVNINTDHGIINNGTVAYCSVMLARSVTDGRDA